MGTSTHPSSLENGYPEWVVLTMCLLLRRLSVPPGESETRRVGTGRRASHALTNGDEQREHKAAERKATKGTISFSEEPAA